MPRMAPAARRLIVALAVAATLAVVAVGAVGLARSGDDGMPARLAMGQPNVGDRWAYDAVLEGDWPAAANDTVQAGVAFRYAEFRWSTPGPLRDAAGQAILADRLQVNVTDLRDVEDAQGQRWVPALHQYDLWAGEAIPVAHESARPTLGGDNSPTLATLAGQDLTYYDVHTVHGWAREFSDAPVPCLARTAVQGTDLDPTTGFEAALGPCLPGGLADGPAVSFKARGIEQVSGWSTVRFEAGRDGPTVWLAASLPVPVQLRAVLDGRAATLTLAGFEPGQVPLGFGEWPAGRDADEVSFAPRLPWGLDDAGLDHPFPASKAYQVALADPVWSDLRDWTVAHPDAFAYYLEHRPNNGNHRIGWTFALAGGDDRFAFSATREPEDLLVLVPTPRGLPEQFTFERMDWILPVVGPAPPAEAVPDELPTVASLLARWADYREGGYQDGPGWGFLLSCPATPCHRAETFAVAGNRPITLMSVPNETPSARLGLSYTQDGSQVEVRDGQTTAYVRWNEAAMYGASTGPFGPGGGFKDGGAATSATVGEAGLTGLLPSPAESAALGAVGLLAGLLYYLWPAIKAGPVALFSRLTGPALLDHPVRARLLQIVQSEPGIHFNDLVRRADVPNGTAFHHVRKLEAANLLAARSLGRYTCYFPGSSPDRSTLAAAPVTRSDGARRILSELRANPGLSGQEVADRLGFQPSTVAYHVRRMEEAGLVASARDGRVVRLRALAGA